MAKGTKKRSRETRVRKNNRIAMVCITCVVLLMLVLLVYNGQSVKRGIRENQEKSARLEEQIKNEKKRSKDIAKLQEEVQSDEYIEKTAKEKIGLIKDNEIIFKEGE